jgi:hypothetical protein
MSGNGNGVWTAIEPRSSAVFLPTGFVSEFPIPDPVNAPETLTMALALLATGYLLRTGGDGAPVAEPTADSPA